MIRIQGVPKKLFQSEHIKIMIKKCAKVIQRFYSFIIFVKYYWSTLYLS